MKVVFAVAPQTASLTADTMVAFADALEGSEFDGIWLSDIPAWRPAESVRSWADQTAWLADTILGLQT